MLCWLLIVLPTFARLCQASVTWPEYGFLDFSHLNISADSRYRIEKNLMIFAAEQTADFERSVNHFTSLPSTQYEREKIAGASSHHSTSDKTENVNVVFVRTVPKSTLKKILTKLSDGEYLGKGFDGQLLRVNTKGIERVTISNAWTRSTRGCDCTPLQEKNCACCSKGGCLCAENKRMCVECGRELDCINQNSIADTASFRFGEKADGPNRLVLMASGRSLTFAYDLRRTLELTKDSGGRMQLHFPNKISSLAYEEIFVYDRGLRRRRILFVFFELEALNKVFEVQLRSGAFHLRELYTWTAKGEGFQSVKINGRTFIGYLHYQELRFDEVKFESYGADVKLFQRFPGAKIYTWRVSKIRRDVYLLAIIDHYVQTYIFTGNGFELHQKLGPFSSPSILLPIRKNNSLWILGSQELLLYQQDSNAKWKMLQRTPGNFQNGTLISLMEVPHLISNSNDGVEMAEVRLEASETKDDLRKKAKLLSEEFQSLMESLKRVGERQSAFTSFSDARITKSEISQETRITREMDLLVNNASIQSLKQAANSVLKNMQITAAAYKRTKAFLKDVVPKNGTKKLVRGIKHFYGPHTFVKELIVKYASISGRSEERLDTTLQNLVRRDDDETPIQGKKVFRGRVSVKDLRTSTLNGEEAANFVTTQKAVTIKGAKYANGLSVHNNVILGENSRVDGIDLSQEVVQQNGFFEVASCNLKRLKAWSGIVIEEDLVNQHSFRDFTESIFPSEGKVKIPNDAIFDLIVTKGDLEAEMLMGVDSSLLFTEPLLKSADEHMFKAHFSSIHCSDLNAQGINNEKFPRDFVVRSDSWVDFGTKSTPKIHFRDLTVKGLIDNLRTEDLVTRSGVQDVAGRKEFTRGIEVIGDLNVVSKRIDGVDLGMFNANITNRQKMVIFEKTVTVPNLLVNGRVNNFVFNEVVEDLVYDDDTLTHSSARKIFLRDLVVKDRVRSTSLNEYDPNNLVDTKTPVNITGKKEFEKDLVIDTLTARGLIDKTNISELFNNSLRLGKPFQVVTGPKYFEKIAVDNLKLTTLLNGRSFDDLLTKTTDQEISRIIYLNETVIKQMDARSTMAAYGSILNGINLRSWKKRLQRDILDSRLVVEGDVIVNKPLEVKWINGHFVKNLKNLLRKTQTLLSNNVEFNELEVSASVSTNSTLGNAAKLKTTMDSAFHLIKNNYWSGETEWEEAQVDEIEVVNLVNERDLREIEADAVYMKDYSRFFLKGKKTFANGFYIKGDLDAQINGLNLRKLFSRTTPQRIDSAFYFSHFTVPNISLKKFNGLNLNVIKKSQRKKVVINDSLVFAGHVNISRLEIHGYLANLKMQEILQDSIRLDQEALIGGKAFKGLPLFEELKIGKINGQRSFGEKRGQRSFSSLTVGGTLAVELLKANTFITKNKSSLLYEKNLRNFALVGEEMKKLTFKTISIEGETYSNTVNGYKMEEFLTKTTKQDFPSHVSINSMHTTNVSAPKINGFEIKGKLKKGEIKITLPSCTLSNLSIDGDLDVKGVFGLKKIKIPDHLMLLHGPNTFLGSVYFTKKLVTSSLQTTNNINGMKQKVLNKTIEYYRSFFKENFLAEFKKHQYDYITVMEAIFNKECEKTVFLESVARNCPLKEHSFNLLSSQSFNGDLKEREFTPPILLFELGSAVWIVNSLRSCSPKVLKWSETSKRFEMMYSLPTADVGDVVQWITVQSTKDSIHILGVSPKGQKCGSTGSSLWVAKYPLYHLQLVQKLSEASEAFVTSNLVYLNVGSKLVRYEFQKGTLSNEVSLRPSLKFLRSHPLGNGSRLVIRFWEDNYLEIEETNRRLRRLTYMQGVGDVVLLNHLDEVLVLVSRTLSTDRFGWYCELFSYRNLSLFPVMSIHMDSPSQLKPLRIPDRCSINATLFLTLAQSAAPKVLKIQGQTFVKTWAEFPIKLKRSPWAFDFTGSNGIYHLVFGDEESLYTTYLEMKGQKYDKNSFQCKTL